MDKTLRLPLVESGSSSIITEKHLQQTTLKSCEVFLIGEREIWPAQVLITEPPPFLPLVHSGKRSGLYRHLRAEPEAQKWVQKSNEKEDAGEE